MPRVFAILCLIVLALPLRAQDYPVYDELYVNDFADLIAPTQKAHLRDMLKELRERHGIEFTIVTIRRMSDYGHNGPIEPFATGLFNFWGVGNATRNDGIMMFVARYDRLMRIELGSGYGSGKDAAMKRIIDRAITPLFKEDQYGQGIEAGARAVIADLTGVWPGEDTRWKKAVGTVERVFSFLSFLLYPALAALGGFAYWLYRRFKRYRPRYCPEDGHRMQLLAEHWDDRHLLAGQILEEKLKSVDYDVWECPECGHIKIEVHRAWFSSYGACRSCKFKTLEGETTILKSATTSSTGRKRIAYSCHHCGDSYAVEKVIPKRSKSSSSSSSSSFGGGSSSGGGASGSW